MMKSFIKLIFIFIPVTSSIAQKTDFQTSVFTVTRPGISVHPTLDHYPYLAVSVMFRNEDKLADKEFMGKFNKADFFYAEFSVSYGEKTETAPLYFLKKEKGRFSTGIFKDKTIIRKMVVNKYSSVMPSAGITLNMQVKNEAVEIIKAITGKITPIIQNPATVFGPTAPAAMLGFLNDVINQLSAKKEINAAVNFDLFTPAESGIHPYSYQVVILKPGTVQIQGTGFEIKTDSDNNLKLFRDGFVFRDYPYFIIETGLSNYVDASGLPSKYYRQHGNCNITGEELAQLQNSFAWVKSKLSDAHMAAEENLLDLYRYMLIIEAVVSLQSSEKENDKYFQAYNALFDFRNKFREVTVEPVLYKGHFEPIYNNFNACIDHASRSLPLYKLLVPLFSIFEKGLDEINNSDLAILYNYLDNTKDLTFFQNSRFNFSAVTTIRASENNIYDKLFSQPVNRILSATEPSDSVKTEMKNIIALKNSFDKCMRCREESQKAEKHFTELLNNELKRRNQIQDVVSNTNDILSKGFSALMKLNLVVEQSRDSITGKSTVVPPLDIPAFSATLQTLKENKENLNRKLSLPQFSQADRMETDRLIAKCNAVIKEISSATDKKLTPFFNQVGLFEK
ncbi:MAG: hypothetical protein HYY40_03760 [Bacteroidetes bacterium]|nr:hypothetical protein [Bacteroidota bacterium]